MVMTSSDAGHNGRVKDNQMECDVKQESGQELVRGRNKRMNDEKCVHEININHDMTFTFKIQKQMNEHQRKGNIWQNEMEIVSQD